MTPREIELVNYIACFAFRRFSVARRFKVALCHRRDTQRAGGPDKPLSPRERHYLHRLAWRYLEKEKMHPLVIPVKEWLAANPQLPTTEEERAMRAQERAAARESKAKAREIAKRDGEQMGLL